MVPTKREIGQSCPITDPLHGNSPCRKQCVYDLQEGGALGLWRDCGCGGQRLKFEHKTNKVVDPNKHACDSDR